MRKILIAIPVYRRDEMALNCIMSLMQTTLFPDNSIVNVVVGVNEATEELFERLDQIPPLSNNGKVHVTYINYGKNLGKPRVVNDIATKYSFDFLVSLDGDMICTNPRWLVDMIKVYELYHKQPIFANINGKRTPIPLGSLCANQTGNNCHVVDKHPGMISHQVGDFTLIGNSSCSCVAGGILMTDANTWKLIGGYSSDHVYGGDDGYYGSQCHKYVKWMCYVKEISFYHPHELNKEYMDWKNRALNTIRKSGPALREDEMGGFSSL